MAPEAVQATAEAEQGFTGQPVQEGAGCIGIIDEILAIAQMMIGRLVLPHIRMRASLNRKQGSRRRKGRVPLDPRLPGGG